MSNMYSEQPETNQEDVFMKDFKLFKQIKNAESNTDILFIDKIHENEHDNLKVNIIFKMF